MRGRLRLALTGALVVGILFLAHSQAIGRVQAAGVTSRILSLLPAAPATPQDRVAAVSIQRFARLRTALDFYVGTGRLAGYENHLGDGLVILRGTATDLAGVAADLQTPLLADDPSGRATQAARFGAPVAAASTAGVSTTLTANATIGDSSVFGSSPDEKTVVGKLYDANGNFLARAIDDSQDGSYTLFFGRYDHIPMMPGYSVRLEAGVRRLTLQIARVRVTGNRTADIIGGQGPRNSGVIITVSHFDWTESGTEQENFETAANTDAAGKFAFDISAFLDLVGGDSVAVRYEFKGTDNSVTVRGTVPYINAFTDRAVVSGYANAAQNVKVTVKSRQNKVLFSATVRPGLDGQFSLLLTDGLLSTTLKALMSVTVELPGLSLKLPKSSALLDVSAEQVTGKGPANQCLRVLTQNPFYTHYGQVDKLGRFSVDLSGGSAITTGTTAAVVFRAPSGDQVYRFVE